MKPRLDLNSLPVQMILSFIAVVLLTSAAVGIPAIWLIRDQLDRQAWSRLEQGQRTSLALYRARQDELEDLAILFAQRPTLQQYLLASEGTTRKDDDDLIAYLETLRSGAGLDLVLLCSPQHQVIASTKPAIPPDVCLDWGEGNYHVLQVADQPQVWLAAVHPLELVSSSTRVLVGLYLDDGFTRLMSAETGMDHTIWAGSVPSATSLAAGWAAVRDQELSPALVSGLRASPGGTSRSTYRHQGQPYFSIQDPLSPTDIFAESALDVSTIASTQRTLVIIMAGAILFVAFIVSALGVYLSRRISKPLVQLAAAAERFRQGDLSSPVVVETSVGEVAQVARALESARLDLQSTLNNLEQEKAWVDHLLESIVEGIMTLDSQSRITYFSKGAERITGWHSNQVIGRSCDDVFILPEADATFSQSIHNTGSRTKLVVELADSHRATLAVTRAHLAPLEARDAQSVLVFRDVSEGELIHRILGNFLANIAHEFRTPLSSAAASVELLIDQAPELSDAELHELLIALHLGILGLGTLVDNLLECASIEAGRFSVSPRVCQLSSIIHHASQTMQPLLQKYGQRVVVVKPEGLPAVHADARRIEQVLVNLISNASKYGPTGALIQVEVEADQEWATIRVVDQGPGVAQEQRAYLFRMVTYPGNLDISSKAGAGLGLMVVKAVVEAHGGQVGLDDRPDGGSIFWFKLPLYGLDDSPHESDPSVGER